MNVTERQRALMGLRRLGLVTAVGIGPRNADTWALTDDGWVMWGQR